MSPAVGPAAVMGFYFFPRGGSAQVAVMCRALAGGPWGSNAVGGSLGGVAEFTNAGRFFGGVLLPVPGLHAGGGAMGRWR